MAVNEIQIGRWGNILHKLLAMKEGNPAPILAPEVIPTVVLEAERPEWNFLANVVNAWGFVDQAAAVGQVAQCGILNPVGSNVLAVLESVSVSKVDANQFRLYVLFQDNAVTPTRGSYRDFRFGRRGGASTDLQGGSTTLFNTSSVAIPTNSRQVALFWHDSVVNVDIPLDVVLPPNSILFVANVSSNEFLAASFRWRERALEPSETR
jgi:hypothetical protein